MACWNGIVIQAMVLNYLKPELFENTYIGTYTRISLYYLELTANSFNIFVLCQKRVCFFIVKNESFISVSRNIFQNDENLTFRRPSPFLSKQKQKKIFEKDFKWPQMQLSDLTMKKQILFGQIWKRLKIIVVDLNHYELILIYISNVKF